MEIEEYKDLIKYTNTHVCVYDKDGLVFTKSTMVDPSELTAHIFKLIHDMEEEMIVNRIIEEDIIVDKLCKNQPDL